MCQTHFSDSLSFSLSLTYTHAYTNIKCLFSVQKIPYSVFHIFSVKHKKYIFKGIQDRFTTCFKTCETNSCFFPKRFKKLTKRGQYQGKRSKKWWKNVFTKIFRLSSWPRGECWPPFRPHISRQISPNLKLFWIVTWGEIICPFLS